VNDLQERPNRNPFGDAPIAARPGGNAVAQSDQQRAIAEVQAAMVIARMNPRDPVAAVDRILNACTRPTLADAAVYQYSRGGSDISGPSIRLAEAMAQSWGNMQFGIRELEQRGGESTVQAFAWDVETNTRREVTFQVPHIRHTRAGAKRLEDPRDVYELVANQGARRLRACILAVIPGDVTEAAVAQCEATMKAKADTSPEAMAKMLSAFEQFGISKAQIEARIQRRLDAIQPAQVVALKKIYASLRDGMSTPTDWFDPLPVDDSGGQGGDPAQPPAAPASASDKAKAAIRARASAKAPDATGGTPDQATPGDQSSGKGEGASTPPGASYAVLADRAQKAASRDAALEVLDTARHLPAQQQTELAALVDKAFPEA
jgi:hypothetical protein